jgi:hypothetical protein
MRFQKENGLAADGIVGGRTKVALSAPTKAPPPPNLSKFLGELGALEDFVRHVVVLEATRPTASAVFAALTDFGGTATRKRYLLVKGDKVGVVDFRHFFAAAAESYNSSYSKPKIGVALGGNPGQTMLLGVGNELAQCFQEAVARKLNSCFSAEDLGTNRLGAEFGELVKVRESMAGGQRVSQLLREYLTRLKPAAPDQASSVSMSSGWEVAAEALTAILAGIGDIIIPRAY